MARHFVKQAGPDLSNIDEEEEYEIKLEADRLFGEEVLGMVYRELQGKAKRRAYPERSDRKMLIDRIAGVVEGAYREHGREMLWTVEGEVLKRRKKALMGLLEGCEEEFPDPDCLSVTESLARFEFTPAEFTYEGLDDQYFIVLACALWMLDDLARTGNLKEAYRYLPGSPVKLHDAYLPKRFHAPEYDSLLVGSVMHAIIHRNLPDGKERDGRTVIFADPLTAGGTHRGTGTENRRNMDGLLSLLDRERMEGAAERFAQKQRDMLARAVHGSAVFDAVDTDIARKLYRPSSILMVQPPGGNGANWERLFQKSHENAEDRTGFLMGFPYHFTASYREARKELANPRAARAFKGFSVDDPYEVCFGLLYLLETGRDEPWLFYSGSSVIMAAASLLPWYRCTWDWDEEEYDDWPEEWDEDEYDGWPEDWDEEEHGFGPEDWEGTDGGADGDEDLDWDGGLRLPEEEWLEDYAANVRKTHERRLAGSRSIAQFFYETTGSVLPRRALANEWMQSMLEKAGFTSQESAQAAAVLGLMMLSADPARADNLSGSVPDGTGGLTEEEREEGSGGQGEEDVQAAMQDGSEGAGEEVLRLQDKVRELERYKKESKNLKKLLSEMQRSTAEAYEQYEDKLRELRREHRELADLREWFFNSRHGEDADGPAAVPSRFPYAVQHRIVAFGGHDTFRKAIRPMLPDVRFIEPDHTGFDQAVIRNADMVWLQNNCLSHAQFYGIINAARRYGKQVRYFSFSSAEKCAQQIVDADREMAGKGTER